VEESIGRLVVDMRTIKDHTIRLMAAAKSNAFLAFRVQYAAMMVIPIT